MKIELAQMINVLLLVTLLAGILWVTSLIVEKADRKGCPEPSASSVQAEGKNWGVDASLNPRGFKTPLN